MKELSYGILVNCAGHNRYANPEAPERVVKYITRKNGMPAKDLLAWGGIGVAEYLGVDMIVNQICDVQKLHKRKGNFGRYIDHEVYSLSSEEEMSVCENCLDIDRIARKMAYDFYESDNCQVVYGVHRPDKEEKHLHIHFAINTVNYKTGKKRRENKRQTKEREKRFQKIIQDETCSCNKK